LRFEEYKRVGSTAVIDIHTHVYPPRYVALLRARESVPRIIHRDGIDRMQILPGEDATSAAGGAMAAGRPIGSEHWDPARKLAFMDRHGITVSLLSPANPWLDFLPADQAPAIAAEVNDDMAALCAAGGGRFYGLGLLPMNNPNAAAAELDRLAALGDLRGAIISSRAGGAALDDRALDPVWDAASRNGQMIFLHPQYGLGTDQLGNYGTAMLLGLSFPFETAVSVARMILGGVFDRFPDLKFMVSHAGGALPYLAARLDAGVATDPATPVRLRQPPSAYLRQLYYDAIGYQTASLELLMSIADPSRIMFGTDAPFFAPKVPNAELDTAEWHAPTAHIALAQSLGPDAAAAILHANAARIFAITLPAPSHADPNHT
jgi:predicted TIM-barrel fold metal-dependent hydrolase